MQRTLQRKIFDLNGYYQEIEADACGYDDVLKYMRSRFDVTSASAIPSTSGIPASYGDMIVNKVRGEKYSIMTKVDFIGDRTDNFFFEMWHDIDSYDPGWLLYSHADYLVYYLKNSGDIYFMNIKKLKDWAFKENNISKYQQKIQKTMHGQTMTLGYIVPIWDISRLDWCTNVNIRNK